MSRRGIGAVVLGLACVLMISGCGKKVVSQSTVEKQVAQQLAAQVHQPLPKVVCPGDLDAKVGTTMKCTLTPQASSQVLPVTVTVTSVTNGVAHFHAVVGQATSGSGQ